MIAALAHNLLRWTHLIALADQTVRTPRILRRRLLAIPGRLTRTARRTRLRMPARWPWAKDFLSPPDCARSHHSPDALSGQDDEPPPEPPALRAAHNPRPSTASRTPATDPPPHNARSTCSNGLPDLPHNRSRAPQAPNRPNGGSRLREGMQSVLTCGLN